MIKVNLSNANILLNDIQKKMQSQVNKIHENIKTKINDDKEKLGWFNWPNTISSEDIINMENKANELWQKNINTLLVISSDAMCLGSASGLDLIYGIYPKNKFNIFYAGGTLSAAYIEQVIRKLENIPFAINIISKSGSNVETMVSFRIFRQLLEAKVGLEESQKRIIATTGDSGILRELAEKNNYTVFKIPENITNKYSILTPATLFPLIYSGVNVIDIINGAKQAVIDTNNPNILTNDAYKYAIGRYIISNHKKLNTEIFISYERQLSNFCQWWKHLFNQIDNNNSILPVTAAFIDDLYYGGKNHFQTVIKLKNVDSTLILPNSHHENDDEIEYIANIKVSEINNILLNSNVQFYGIEQKIPHIILELQELSASSFGYITQFMLISSLMYANLLNKNPFVQVNNKMRRETLKNNLKNFMLNKD